MRSPVRRWVTIPVALLLATVLLVGSPAVPSQRNPYPIQHVIVIVEENHSFDNYFGTFPGANGIQNAPKPYHDAEHVMKSSAHDPCHTAKCFQAYFNDGKMNGWTDPEAFGYYTAKSIPYYWALAKNYTLMDNLFSGFMGPSLPNRVSLIAGSNYGGTTNQNAYDGQRLNVTIFDLLNTAGVSWKYYTGYPDSFNGFNPLPLTVGGHRATDYSVFKKDVASHKLPQVSWLMPPADDLSEHPPYNVTLGMTLVKEAIDSVMKSSYWSSTAILLTWDEAGGYYDHVAPPNTNFGFRVPMIVVSPYALHGSVDHTFSSHASILAFIERLFNLPCMKSDCNSSDLMEAFYHTGNVKLHPTGAFDVTGLLLIPAREPSVLAAP